MEEEKQIPAKKRQQRTVGAIVKIPLEDGFWAYARILHTRLAFYDLRTQVDFPISEIVEKEVLFFASVYDYAITQGYWEKIGKKMPLEEKLLTLPPVYIQSVLNVNYFQICDENGIRPASREECIGLESLTTWTPHGIEKRLNDHFLKRYNPRVAYMLSARIADFIALNPKDYAHPI